jgi:hypothetical protein
MEEDLVERPQDHTGREREFTESSFPGDPARILGIWNTYLASLISCQVNTTKKLFSSFSTLSDTRIRQLIPA